MEVQVLNGELLTLDFEPMLSRSDLQVFLQLSPRTISKLAANGGLPAPIRLGAQWRWRRSDIVRFLQQRAEAKVG